MTELTAMNVEGLMRECLYQDDEVSDNETPSGAVIVEGIVNKYAFHPQRLESARQKVVDMIGQLPAQFLREGGGGWTFLNLCQRADGEQWTGLHLTMESLTCLAIGMKMATFVVPRALWSMFPGGMPYVVFSVLGGVENAAAA